ncbi:MAG: type II toxin-antitoxin system HicA family toxin [Oscillospiraceae bacterium]|nr:type II toxin-antitoxin system HicA family toxin [Oscillospiraceae bacterium]
MSKKEKLINRLKSRPRDFTINELDTLMSHMGFWKRNAGKTSGSRIEYTNDGKKFIKLHRPHPGNEYKPYQLDDIIDDLKGRGLL